MFLDCLFSSPAKLPGIDDAFGLNRSDFPSIYWIMGGLTTKLLQGRSIATLRLKLARSHPAAFGADTGAQWQLALFLLEDLQDAQLQPNQAPAQLSVSGLIRSVPSLRCWIWMQKEIKSWRFLMFSVGQSVLTSGSRLFVICLSRPVALVASTRRCPVSINSFNAQLSQCWT